MRWLACACLLSCLATGWAAPAPKAADLQKLKDNIAQAQQRVAQSQGQHQQLQQQLKHSEMQLAKISVALEQSERAIAKQQAHLNQLAQQQQQLIQQQNTQALLLKKQVQLSYRLGRENPIKLLLNQQDPEKISRSQVYAHYFNQARLQALQQYQSTLEQVQQNQAAISQETQQLQQSRQQQLSQQQQLKDSQQQRRDSMAALESTMRSDQQKIKQWQQEQKHLQRLLDEINQAVSNIHLPSDAKPFASMQHQLPWPVKGRLKNRFGQRRPPGHLQWEGIAIDARQGTPVRAIAHGRVVFADWFRGKGLLLIIDHGNGYMSLYAHNQSLLFETGDWVSSQEVIASVGNSGGLKQSELYFEIRYQGKPINPLQWLKN